MDPQPPPPTPASPAEVPTKAGPVPSPKFPYIPVLSLLVVILAATTAFLLYQNTRLQPRTDYIVYPSPTQSVTNPLLPTVTPINSSWKTYTDTTYNFQIRYPNTYGITTDPTGWPNAVLILYKGGQSYDFVIEAWTDKTSYLAKYPNQPGGRFTVKQSGSTYFTLLNQNDDREVDQILSTFTFDDQTSNVRSLWKTYTNQQYGFSIQYPPTWISEKYSPTDTRIPYLKNPANDYSVQFLYYKDQPGKISDFDGKELVYDTTGQKRVVINGITAYVRENFQGNDGMYTAYAFQISAGEYIRLLLPLTEGPVMEKFTQNDVDTAIAIAQSFRLNK